MARIRTGSWFSATGRGLLAGVALLFACGQLQGEPPSPASQNDDPAGETALQVEIAKAQAASKSAKEER